MSEFSQIFYKFWDWQRLGQQKSLSLVAAGRLQKLENICRLDAFGDHIQIQRMRQLDDSADELGIQATLRF